MENSKSKFAGMILTYLGSALSVVLIAWTVKSMRAPDGEQMDPVVPPADEQAQSQAAPEAAPSKEKLAETKSAAPSAPPVPPAVPNDGCYTVTYRHPKAAGHKDRESCGKHRNQIPLAELVGKAPLKKGSVCVRLDGEPVAYEWAKGDLLLAPLAGPDSAVSVRYCLGKSKCGDPCPKPDDPFMKVIGANLDAGTGWDGKGDPAGESLKEEVRSVLADSGTEGQAVLKGWTRSETQSGCGPALARH